MRCLCCDVDIATARKVKIRHLPAHDPALTLPGTPAAIAYDEAMIYRWGIVCEGCYRTLDNGIGVNAIRGRAFNLAGASRFGKATTIDEEKYRRWQRREAEKLGLELPGDDDQLE